MLKKKLERCPRDVCGGHKGIFMNFGAVMGIEEADKASVTGLVC